MEIKTGSCHNISPQVNLRHGTEVLVNVLFLLLTQTIMRYYFEIIRGSKAFIADFMVEKMHCNRVTLYTEGPHNKVDNNVIPYCMN